MNTSIDTIATLAATVATEHTAAVEAHAAVHEAEAVLLTRVVEAARPALRAVSSKRRISERTFWPDSACNATEHKSGPLALRVSGTGYEYDHPRANRGSVEGIDLFLYPDGTFVEASYSGSWTRWQGESSSWEATDTTLTAEAVAEAYDVEAIIAAIGEALTKAKGTRATSTAKAVERADRVRAVVALL